MLREGRRSGELDGSAEVIVGEVRVGDGDGRVEGLVIMRVEVESQLLSSLNTKRRRKLTCRSQVEGGEGKL